MLHLSKLMSCLYDCFYTLLQYKNEAWAFEAVVSSLGFSIEANIKARTWVLCGQSDIDYYQPHLNRGFEVSWLNVTLLEFEQRLTSLVSAPYPLIIETDPTLVPYYEPGSLEIGMPHAFLLLSWDKETNKALVYDRLAVNSTMQKDERNFFHVDLGLLYPAFEKKIHLAEIKSNPITIEWKEEVDYLLRKSVSNMEKKVSRAQLAYQVFGFEAIQYFADTLKQFNPNYHDDVQSIWLLSHHLPLAIFQSVYGNRFLFKKMLSKMGGDQYQPIILALNHSLDAWGKLRKEFILCANGKSSYAALNNILQHISVKEIEM